MLENASNYQIVDVDHSQYNLASSADRCRFVGIHLLEFDENILEVGGQALAVQGRY